jgi:hypothetical protein
MTILERQYHVPGGHQVITSCAMPPALPPHIVDMMVAHFKNEVRLEIVRRLTPTSTGRQCTVSTISHAISVASNAGIGISGAYVGIVAFCRSFASKLRLGKRDKVQSSKN